MNWLFSNAILGSVFIQLHTYIKINHVEFLSPHITDGSIIHDVATSLITNVNSIFFINTVVVIMVINLWEFHKLSLWHSILTKHKQSVTMCNCHLFVSFLQHLPCLYFIRWILVSQFCLQFLPPFVPKKIFHEKWNRFFTGQMPSISVKIQKRTQCIDCSKSLCLHPL